MVHNDVLRSLRYLLNVREETLREILALVDCAIGPEEIAAYLCREDEPGFVLCPDEVMSAFLNGLVIHLRGRDENRPPAPIETPVTNNLIMKKIRVAFELKDTDIIELIERPGVLKVTKSELGAFFRHPDHRNYRPCGDQYLRNLLKGLTP